MCKIVMCHYINHTYLFNYSSGNSQAEAKLVCLPSCLIRDFDSTAEKRAGETRLGHVPSILSCQNHSIFHLIVPNIHHTGTDVNTILRSKEPPMNI